MYFIIFKIFNIYLKLVINLRNELNSYLLISYIRQIYCHEISNVFVLKS